jgi:hypothetical protein
MAQKRAAFLPPDILALYHDIDHELPLFLTRAMNEQLDREYKYARDGQRIAAGAIVLAVGGFVYLVMQNHSTEAYMLLGTQVIGLITALLRTRLAHVVSPAEEPEPRSTEIVPTRE